MKWQSLCAGGVLVSLLIAAPGHVAFAQKVAVGGKKSPKFSKLDIIAWHLQQGEDLKDEGRIDAAKAHWREVLRIDPKNHAARMALDTASLPGINVVGRVQKTEQIDVAAVSADVRDAIKRWVDATDIAGVAEVLEDRTADPLGKRLLRAYRESIMKVDGGVHSPDTQLFDEFERYVDSNNLNAVINEIADGTRSSDMGRLYGRELIRSVQKWERRAIFSGIEMTLVRPYGIDKAARHLEKVQLSIVNKDLVLIDDPDFDDPVPLEARFEDGKWRIGSRPGSTLFYDVRINLAGTHRLRRVH